METKANTPPFEVVETILREYLEKKGHRKTPERFTILKEIYAMEGHFDIEALYSKMKEHKYRVSRATLYNTAELLLDCNLIIKHQFGHHSAQYEKSFQYGQHDHFIDTETGKVLEFWDPRMEKVKKFVEENLGVKISNHSLVFYGVKKV